VIYIGDLAKILKKNGADLEIFKFNGEKYKVLSGDDGLIVEPLNNMVSEKSQLEGNDETK